MLRLQIPLRRDPAEMGTIGLLVTLVVAVFATVYIHKPSYLLFPMYKQFWMIVSLVCSACSAVNSLHLLCCADQTRAPTGLAQPCLPRLNKASRRDSTCAASQPLVHVLTHEHVEKAYYATAHVFEHTCVLCSPQPLSEAPS